MIAPVLLVGCDICGRTVQLAVENQVERIAEKLPEGWTPQIEQVNNIPALKGIVTACRECNAELVEIVQKRRTKGRPRARKG